MRGWSNFPSLTYFYGTGIIQKPGPDPSSPEFYHDPTRYLSSQFLGAINAQKGSFNVS